MTLDVRRRGSRVKVEGLEELTAKLRDPRLVADPLRDMLTEASKLGQKVAVEGVDGGKGLAVRSINRWVNPTNARVTSAMPKARVESIEKGRRPGINPRAILAQIINWKNAVGHPQTGYEIALGIARRGVKGRFFMKAARDAVANEMPRLLREMGQRIQKQWLK